MIETWTAAHEIRQQQRQQQHRDTAALHQKIQELYLWWAKEAPGVTPVNDPLLEKLWAEVDLREAAPRREGGRGEG